MATSEATGDYELKIVCLYRISDTSPWFKKDPGYITEQKIYIILKSEFE